MINQLNRVLRWFIFLTSERLEITKLIHKFYVLLRAYDTIDAFSVFVWCNSLCYLITYPVDASCCFLPANFSRGEVNMLCEMLELLKSQEEGWAAIKASLIFFLRLSSIPRV
jgi:hypothetical protein